MISYGQFVLIIFLSNVLLGKTDGWQEGGGRLQCSLCHQVIPQHHGELGGGGRPALGIEGGVQLPMNGRE